MAKRPTSKAKSPRTNIPSEQMDLPVSFDPSGKLITLGQLLEDRHRAFATLASLSSEKRAELTVNRLAAQPDFELAMIGGGLVDRERAIQEVKAQSEVGRVLVEIEQRLIQHLLDEVAIQRSQNKSSRPKVASRRSPRAVAPASPNEPVPSPHTREPAEA